MCTGVGSCQRIDSLVWIDDGRCAREWCMNDKRYCGTSQGVRSKACVVSAFDIYICEVEGVSLSDQQNDMRRSRGLSMGIRRVTSKDGIRRLEQHGYAAPTLLTSTHYMFSSLAMTAGGSLAEPQVPM